MKKFECLGCNSKRCYVKQEDDILAPCCCVHGWNGDTNWHEVEKQENTKGVAITEEEKIDRDKLITSLLIDFYFNRCEGIKTETLQKIEDLVNWDLKEYYGE